MRKYRPVIGAFFLGGALVAGVAIALAAGSPIAVSYRFVPGNANDSCGHYYSFSPPEGTYSGRVTVTAIIYSCDAYGDQIYAYFSPTQVSPTYFYGAQIIVSATACIGFYNNYAGDAGMEVRGCDQYNYCNKIWNISFPRPTSNGILCSTYISPVILPSNRSARFYIVAGSYGHIFANPQRFGHITMTIAITMPDWSPDPELFKPLKDITATTSNQSYALYQLDRYTDVVVHAPAGGRVVEVADDYVVVSSTALDAYKISAIAPKFLLGRDIAGGCALGFAPRPSVEVWATKSFSPNLASQLILLPSNDPCADSFHCFQEIVKEETAGAVTITLPARIFAGPAYHLDFDKPEAMTGALYVEASNARPETFMNIYLYERNPYAQIWNGILQIPFRDKTGYLISPTQFVRENRLRWYLNPTGGMDLHKICVSSLSGGRLYGICPSPEEDEWHLGEKASWVSGNALLEDGGWIWKEETIILPPSPQSVAPSGIQGVGTGEVEPSAISGRYDIRVRARAVSGAPELLLEKELAPGVWKELGRASVMSDAAYIPYTVQFDTGQQFLTIRLRASGGGVEVGEICDQEEEREAELIAPCFGIEPYNPSDPGCNLLECPGLQVRYQMQRLHDIALLPPLCKIAYWVNYLYYYALNTVGKPILTYLTTIIELIRDKGFFGGIAEAIRIILESLWVSVVKPYGTQIVRWVWGAIQPVLDFLGVSEYTLKLLQNFFSLLFRLFSKAFQVLANGTIGLVRAAWLGFRNALSSTPTTPPIPPQEIQAGFELVGYSVGNILIIPLAVIFTGLLMWQFFFWSLRILGIVK